MKKAAQRAAFFVSTLSRSRKRTFHMCGANISPRSDFTCRRQISLRLARSRKRYQYISQSGSSILCRASI